MRSRAVLSAVVVVCGAAATSPRQVGHEITALLSVDDVATPLVGGAGPGGIAPGGAPVGAEFSGNLTPDLGIPVIYVAVALIFYRLLTAPLESVLERRGRPRAVASAQGLGLIAGLLVGALYVHSTMTYVRSLSYLETTSVRAVDPLPVVRDGTLVGAGVALAATMVALTVAVALAVRGRRDGATGGPGVWRGAGVVELVCCGVIGVVQTLGSPSGDPRWPAAVAVAGIALAVGVNLVRGRSVTAATATTAPG